MSCQAAVLAITFAECKLFVVLAYIYDIIWPEPRHTFWWPLERNINLIRRYGSRKQELLHPLAEGVETDIDGQCISTFSKLM